MLSHYLYIYSFLDEDSPKFTPVSLEGEEGVCKNFHYRITVASKKRLTEDDYLYLLGFPMLLFMSYQTASGGKIRCINGTVHNTTEMGAYKSKKAPGTTEWHYQIEISSWLNRFKYFEDCRIFQKNSNTTISIIEELLGNSVHLLDRGDLTGQKRDFTVMYNESIYNFILRLLDEEGFIWYFRHEMTSHELVLSEDIKDDTKHPILESVGEYDRFRTFSPLHSHNPTKDYKSSNFNWETKKVSSNPKKTTDPFAYHYPGSFRAKLVGDEVDVILKATTETGYNKIESQRLIYEGESDIRALAAGHIFTSHTPFMKNLHNQEYIVLNLEIKADILPGLVFPCVHSRIGFRYCGLVSAIFVLLLFLGFGVFP